MDRSDKEKHFSHIDLLIIAEIQCRHRAEVSKLQGIIDKLTKPRRSRRSRRNRSREGCRARRVDGKSDLCISAFV